LAYSLPVGTDGWRMGLNTSAMSYEVVVGEQGMVGAVGHAVTQGLEWLYPLLRADDRSATVTLTADAKKFQNTSAQGLLMSDYEAKVLAAQVSGFYRDLNPGGGTGTYALQLSHGHINLDGSLSQQTDSTTVQTAGMFDKLRVNGTWQQSLSTQTSAFVSYTGQVADRNLDSSEKMQLGGMNGVRAYPTGEGSGSDAQLVQLELRHRLESGVNLTGFYDWGQIWLQHDPSYPGGPQHNRNTYKGFGASVAFTNDDGVNFKATWARRQGSNPNPTQTGNDQDGTRDRNRYWLQVTLPF
jgi:hemolysin activation/secretion protein